MLLGKALELFFIRIWVIVKLTLLFWLLSLSGALVLGIGPAFKAITELHIMQGWRYKEITVKAAYELFKRDFVRGNAIFWFFNAIALFLLYNLYLSLQIQGLLFLMIDFILLFVLTYLLTAFEYALVLDSRFEVSFSLLIKMSLISNFSSFLTYLKMLLGSLFILGLTWRFKGLILFGLAGLLQVYCSHVTQKWCLELDEKLAE